MTKEQIKKFRSIVEKLNTGYAIRLGDGNTYLTSKGDLSKLIYDDANEMIYNFKPTTNYYMKEGSANLLATTFDNVMALDIDMIPTDLKKVLDSFVDSGLITKEESEKYFESMNIDKPVKYVKQKS